MGQLSDFDKRTERLLIVLSLSPCSTDSTTGGVARRCDMIHASKSGVSPSEFQSVQPIIPEKLSSEAEIDRALSVNGNCPRPVGGVAILIMSA